MMRIAFIYRGAENLGIEYLSAFLRSRGHETQLFFDPAVFSSDVFVNSKWLSRFCSIDEHIVRAVQCAKPDVVAFSVYTGNYQWCLSLARPIHEALGVPIVFGGIHATAVPEEVLSNEFVDYIIRGEGEYAFLELLEHLENKSFLELKGVDNLGLRVGGKIIINPLRPYLQDLDSLPFPDKELFFKAEPILVNNPYLIMSSRGCPYRCTYCGNDLFHDLYSGKGRHVRRRSVDNVIAELEHARDIYPIKSVCFVDDVFTISREWLAEFVPKYRASINLPFYCNIHPLGFNQSIAALLKAGGCRLVFLGVQSGSERIRKEVFLRSESNESIVRCVTCLKEARIPFNADHIFGAPTETEEDLKSSYEFYSRIKPDMMQTFWLTYYPGTRIVSLAKEMGLLTDADVKNIAEGRIGFTHGTGSVPHSHVSLYKKYELLFELITIVPSRRLLKVFSGILSVMPFKKILSMLIFAVTGSIYFRPWILNKFRYVFSFHKRRFACAGKRHQRVD
jgi:anaerobic magnesium-protoporphyrin IX monomethyl ester cyclase